MCNDLTCGAPAMRLEGVQLRRFANVMIMKMLVALWCFLLRFAAGGQAGAVARRLPSLMNQVLAAC